MSEAVFRCSLPSGGAFVAQWPANTSARGFTMAKAMLIATLDLWTDSASRSEASRDAGEIEYASWDAAAIAQQRGSGEGGAA